MIRRGQGGDRWARGVAVVLALIAGAACDGSKKAEPGSPRPVEADSIAPPPSPARSDVTAAASAESGPPKRLFAKKFVAQVRSAPDKDAPRVGYLRGGAVVQAKTAAPIGFAACRKGWYELDAGGFVCSTVDYIAFDGERLPERRPLRPDLAARLPYPYGYSRRKGTPVFRVLPSREDATLYLEGGPPPVIATGAAALAVPPPAGLTPGDTAPEQPTATAQDTPAPPSEVAAAAVNPVRDGTLASPDGGVPTLASLQGAEGGVLLRRMERGFYVSLDEEMEKDGHRYWRTQSNGFIPHDRLSLVEGTEFRGVHLGPETTRLPVGFLLSSRSWAYRLDERGKLRKDSKPGYHYLFEIAGELEHHGTRYWVANDGRHFRDRDAIRIDAREPPKEVGPEEKWIDVDLGAQSLVAYVGAQPVFATLVSSGRPGEESDPLENHVTPTGTFRISSKHLSATMDGDHAIDGPYSIEDVPYVMYFELAYALHAAFWHNGFGRPRSHGCVNLAPEDARWLFGWADPVLPASWHGVYPNTEHPGTRLYIHGETPKP